MIIYSSWLVPNGFVGITIWPFIFLSHSKKWLIEERGQRYHDLLVNHEKIHFRQQIEMLVVLFYILYVLDWIANGFVYKDIVFEREARANENNLDYLVERRFLNWLHYFKK